MVHTHSHIGGSWRFRVHLFPCQHVTQHVAWHHSPALFLLAEFHSLVTWQSSTGHKAETGNQPPTRIARWKTSQDIARMTIIYDTLRVRAYHPHPGSILYIVFIIHTVSPRMYMDIYIYIIFIHMDHVCMLYD